MSDKIRRIEELINSLQPFNHDEEGSYLRVNNYSLLQKMSYYDLYKSFDAYYHSNELRIRIIMDMISEINDDSTRIELLNKLVNHIYFIKGSKEENLLLCSVLCCLKSVANDSMNIEIIKEYIDKVPKIDVANLIISCINGKENIIELIETLLNLNIIDSNFFHENHELDEKILGIWGFTPSYTIAYDIILDDSFFLKILFDIDDKDCAFSIDDIMRENMMEFTPYLFFQINSSLTNDKYKKKFLNNFIKHYLTCQGDIYTILAIVDIFDLPDDVKKEIVQSIPKNEEVINVFLNNKKKFYLNFIDNILEKDDPDFYLLSFFGIDSMYDISYYNEYMQTNDILEYTEYIMKQLLTKYYKKQYSSEFFSCIFKRFTESIILRENILRNIYPKDYYRCDMYYSFGDNLRMGCCDEFAICLNKAFIKNRMSENLTVLNTIFHELRHAKQFCMIKAYSCIGAIPELQDMKLKDIIGRNKYLFLKLIKDEILSGSLRSAGDVSTLNQYNYTRSSFEADARYEGYNDLINYLRKVNPMLVLDAINIVGSTKDKYIRDVERKRMNDDASYETLDVIFDSTFSAEQISSLLAIYPILELEYNSDGSKKSKIELINSLNECDDSDRDAIHKILRRDLIGLVDIIDLPYVDTMRILEECVEISSYEFANEDLEGEAMEYIFDSINAIENYFLINGLDLNHPSGNIYNCLNTLFLNLQKKLPTQKGKTDLQSIGQLKFLLNRLTRNKIKIFKHVSNLIVNGTYSFAGSFKLFKNEIVKMIGLGKNIFSNITMVEPRRLGR